MARLQASGLDTHMTLSDYSPPSCPVSLGCLQMLAGRSQEVGWTSENKQCHVFSPPVYFLWALPVSIFRQHRDRRAASKGKSFVNHFLWVCYYLMFPVFTVAVGLYHLWIWEWRWQWLCTLLLESHGRWWWAGATYLESRSKMPLRTWLKNAFKLSLETCFHLQKWMFHPVTCPSPSFLHCSHLIY